MSDFQHFMLKEICEQPEALSKALAQRVSNNQVDFKDIKITKEEIDNINKVYVIGCGTAYHAGLVIKTIFGKLLGLPVEIEIASEFRYGEPMVDEQTLVVVNSQSGETADTLGALIEAKKKGAKTLGFLNVVDSTMGRECDYVVDILAGPELSVASTKAYTTMLLAEYLFGIYLAKLKGTITIEEEAKMVTELKEIPEKVEAIINQNTFAQLAQNLKKYNTALFVGRGLDYITALEGALKLKETSYIFTDSYPTGELKHGTYAVINDEIPLIVIATQKNTYDKTLANVKELKEKDAYVLCIAIEGDQEIAKYADGVMYIPENNDFFAPLLNIIPLQLLAYHTALSKGLDVDKPRNLTKSVTVE